MATLYFCKRASTVETNDSLRKKTTESNRRTTHLKVSTEAEERLVGGRQWYNNVIDTVHRSVGAALTTVDVTHRETFIIVFQITTSYLSSDKEKLIRILDIKKEEEEEEEEGVIP